MRKLEIERLLAAQGFGSRRECRGLVLAGRVTVGGEDCEDPSAQFEPAENLEYTVDGEAWTYRPQAYLMLHKPAGYECSHHPSHYPSVYSLLPRPLVVRGVQSVGRLDADTTGLLLFSDDGQFIHTYTSPKKKVPKVYEARVKHPLDEAQCSALLQGVQLHDEPLPVAARRCDILAECLLEMTVTEGKYHLVKRMIAAAGNRVEGLHRRAIGNLSLPADLPEGQWRWLGPEELAALAGQGEAAG